MRTVRIAVVGATGVVGKEMLAILAERAFPVEEIIPFCSARSAGTEVDFGNQELITQELTTSSFEKHKIDIALFSAGADVSLTYAPLAAKSGAIVIDNSSAFRMNSTVPLVVPEVNAHAIEQHKGIIANPNCSTIQMVVALNPLHKKAGIRRIVVSTYQAVSGSGKEAMEELWNQVTMISQMKADEIKPKQYPHQIAFNCLPHIDIFLEDGYTKEEHKLVNETKKIMEDNSIAISATTVRVPVFIGHAESVNLELRQELSPEDAQDILEKTPGIILLDDPENNEYPTQLQIAGHDEVFVGRIRADKTVEFGLNLWIAADNLRKGAALNAVQIAELLLVKSLVG